MPREAPQPLAGVLAATAAVTLALVLIAALARLAGPPLLERLATQAGPGAPGYPLRQFQQTVRAEFQAAPPTDAPPSSAIPPNDGGH